MTPEQIRPEAKRRLQTALGTHFNEDPTYMSALAEVALDALGDLLPTGTRYGVRSQTDNGARFADWSLEDCERIAIEYDTHVIEQHLTEWTTHE